MYLKKIDGPSVVKLPDGRELTRADLPSPSTRRWVASRKATVVHAVEHGLIDKKEALETYSLSEEEFQSWRAAIDTHGEKALRTTQLQVYRQVAKA